MQPVIVRKNSIPANIKQHVEDGYHVSVTIELDTNHVLSEISTYVLDALVTITERHTKFYTDCQSFDNLREYTVESLKSVDSHIHDRIRDDFIDIGFNDEMFNECKKGNYENMIGLYFKYTQQLADQFTLHDDEMEQIKNKIGRNDDSFGFMATACLLSNILPLLIKYRDGFKFTVQRKTHLYAGSHCKVLTFYQKGDSKTSTITVDKFVLLFKDEEMAKAFVNEYNDIPIDYMGGTHFCRGLQRKKSINIYNKVSDNITKNLTNKNYGVFLSKRKNPESGLAGYITVNHSTFIDVEPNNIDMVYKSITGQYEKLSAKCSSYDMTLPILETTHSIHNSYLLSNLGNKQYYNGVPLVQFNKVHLCNVRKSDFKTKERLHDIMIDYSSVNGTTHEYKFHIPIYIYSDIQKYRKLLNYMVLTKMPVNTVLLYAHTDDHTVQKKLLELLDEMTI